MATRQRTRPQQPDDFAPENNLLEYETQFDLDNEITEDDVEEFLEEQEVEDALKVEKEGFLNLQTGSGLAIIAIGTIYLLQQTGFLGLAFNLGAFIGLLPWLAGILIVLTGFGVLSWSPSRRRRKARRKARERRNRRRRMEKTMGRTETQTAPTSSPAFEEAKKAAQRAAAEAAIAASRAKSRVDRRRSGTRKRLAKSRQHKVIAGVAGGIAEYLGIDPVLVRIALVIGAVVGNLFTIPLYLILSFVLPTAEALSKPGDDEGPVVRIIRD